MSKSNTFESEILAMIFQNANIANIGDATGLRGSSTAGLLYVSLHTGDPGEAGDQSTNEANYTGYARVGVARTSGGWTLAGQISNAAEVTFGACTAGNNTITHFGIGTSLSGAGKLLYKGAITTPPSGLAVSNGITPRFSAGQLVVSED